MIRDHAIWLSTAIACVLLFATTAAIVLKLRVANGQPHAVIDNLNARIRSWWVMAAVLGSALWAGTAMTFLLFAVLSLIALREYLTALPVTPARTRIAGLVICVVCVSYLPALLILDIPGYEGRNVFLLVFVVLVAQASDVLQYLWGKLCGRHAIAPTISPSKTVEGFAGGIVSATLLGTSLWWITPFSIVQAVAFSLLITLLGFAGGLFMSAQKRLRGIKDWGDLIHGHGGVLDRLDSLWLPAPLFFYAVKYGWAS